ncbi:RING-H2 finger protein ATL68 [Dendrobium catenatum]|uniref:RING-H2 finger protein ATL68 n=2 Tax=Dendrobium catenatum TaxID=906689 RepID=A0A2I0XEM9_9ASPA|nr:RING-H2 finger protein ATL68 [Dendrobium catenatum]
MREMPGNIFATAVGGAGTPPPPPPPFVYSIDGLSTPLTLGLTAALVIFLITFFLAFFFCYHLTLNPRSQNPNPSPDHPIAAASSRVIFVMEDRGVPGLDEEVISSYPKFSFSVNGGGEGLCSICLNEYNEGEMLRSMPECRHCFHILCIDSWLQRHGTCPVCRSSPAPARLLTPTMELLSIPQESVERLRG